MKCVTTILFSLFLFCFIFSSPLVFADDAKLISMLEQMQKTINNLQQTVNRQDARIKALETQQPSVPISESGISPSTTMSDTEFQERLSNSLGGADKWLKNLSFKGDLRLRYEGQDFTSGNPAETDARNRFRYRLRFGWEKKFSDEMKIGFSLTSGEAVNGIQNDPTGTNTTFDKLFNFKDIFIDRAYASYSPAWATYGPLKKTTIIGGKMDNPFERGSSDLVWDRDVKPEGLAEKFEFQLFDGENMDAGSFFTAGQYVLDEDANTGGDAELFAYQLGLTTAIVTSYLSKPIETLSAVSFYSYNDYAIKNNFTIDGTDTVAGTALSGNRGNINTAGSPFELDAQDFEIWDYYNEIAVYPYGVPVRPFVEVAHNVANQHVGDEGLAYAFGTKLGSAVKKGDVEFYYAYRRLESESVVGAFADSDFGLGHSGKRGNIFKVAYAITDVLFFNSSLSVVNNTAVDTSNVRDEEQRRLQLDLLWKI